MRKIVVWPGMCALLVMVTATVADARQSDGEKTILLCSFDSADGITATRGTKCSECRTEVNTDPAQLDQIGQ